MGNVHIKDGEELDLHSFVDKRYVKEDLERLTVVKCSRTTTLKKKKWQKVREMLRLMKQVHALSFAYTSIGLRGELEHVAPVLSALPKLKELDLRENGISLEQMRVVGAEVQKLRELQVLVLKGNPIQAGGMEHVAAAVQGLTFLTSLDLSSTKMGDDGAALCFIGRLPPALHTLKVENCGLGENGVQALATCLGRGSQLETLSLSWNDIGSEGMRHLAPVLKGMPLKSLLLRGCHVGRKGVEYLAHSIKDVNVLDLSRNELGREGAGMVGKLLQDNVALRELFLGCNHMHVEGMRDLAPSLTKCVGLETLELDWNALGLGGIKVLCQVLQGLLCIKVLFLDCNELNEDCAKELIKVMGGLPELQRLGLQGNALGDQLDMICSMMTLLEAARLQREREREPEEEEEGDPSVSLGGRWEALKRVGELEKKGTKMVHTVKAMLEKARQSVEFPLEKEEEGTYGPWKVVSSLLERKDGSGGVDRCVHPQSMDSHRQHGVAKWFVDHEEWEKEVRMYQMFAPKGVCPQLVEVWVDPACSSCRALRDQPGFGQTSQAHHVMMLEACLERSRLDEFVQANVLSELEARVIVSKLGTLLSIMHDKGMAMVDFKPQNVMQLASSVPGGLPRYCLIDMDACADAEKPAPAKGTPQFMSPECARAIQQGKSTTDASAELADAWCLGMTALFVVRQGQVCWESDEKALDVLASLQSGVLPGVTDEENAAMGGALYMLLQVDPSARLSIRQMLSRATWRAGGVSVRSAVEQEKGEREASLVVERSQREAREAAMQVHLLHLQADKG